MKKITSILCALFFAMNGFAFAPTGADPEPVVTAADSVFISQNCDPKSNYAADRFAEIYNASSETVDLSGWTLENVQGGVVEFTWVIDRSIASGEVLVFGRADATNQTISPDVVATWSGGSWNGAGGDGTILMNGAVVVDRAVQVDVNGKFGDKQMVRNPEVCVPSATFDDSQWTFSAVENATDDNATPGEHDCLLPYEPTITDILPVAGSEFVLGAAIAVSATVETQAAGGIDSVLWAYGYAVDALEDTLKCALSGTAATVDMNLMQAGVAYGLMIAYGANGQEAESDVIEFTALCNEVEAPTAVAASDISENAFTARWNASAEAEGYILDVWTKKAATVVASDVFIAAYVEGSSYNQYVALYNGTGAEVDLTNYILCKYVNDASDSTAYSLDGTLAVGETKVYARSSATLYGGNTTISAVCYVTGNDAIALVKDNAVIDIVGTVGGTEDFAKDITLYRKSSINSPSATYSVSDWDQYAKDDVSKLGNHTMDGAAQNVYFVENDTVMATSQVVTGLVSATAYYYAVSAYNQYGCESELSNEIKVIASSATTMAKDDVSSFSVYATPGRLMIRGEERATAVVYAITGRQVVERVVDGQVQIAVPSGIYLVKINDTVTKVAVR